MFIDTNGYLYYTLTANSANPVWFRINLSPTGSAIDFVPYAFSPRYLSGSGNVLLNLATTTRAALVSFDPVDLAVDSVTNQATLTTAVHGLRRIETERKTPGLVAIASTYPGSSTTEVVTTTDNSSWGSPVTINAAASSFAAPGLYVSGRTAGRIYASQGLPSTASEGRVSSNSGASFSDLSSPNIDSFGSAYSLHVPWSGNDGVALFGYDSVPAVGSGVRRLYRAVGGTQTNISPGDGGHSWGGQWIRSIDTHPTNGQRIAAVLRNGTTLAGAGSDILRVYYSRDGGSNWNYIAALDNGAATAYVNVRCAGDDPNIFWVFGAGGKIAKCTFDGAFQNLRGNLGSFSSPTVGGILNIAGM
jgi:hypothetical protein